MKKDQKDFHKSRRKELAGLIGKDSIAVIFGSTHKNKSYDADFRFKQYKNFYYLTGFTEPNSAIVIAPSGIEFEIENKKKTCREILFVQKKDERTETWTGKRLGFQNVKEELGIEAAAENDQIRQILNLGRLKNFNRLYINFAEMIKLTGEMKKTISFFEDNLNKIAPAIEITDVSKLIGIMRLIKTGFEIDKIKKAADISVSAYKKVMEIIKPGLNEQNIHAALEFYYRDFGGEDIAYPPIVASADNACILHYDNNNCRLNNGDLLLIDSASEYNYYCSDITRTFPVNGKFTSEQKIIYNIVLKANKEVIKKIKPGVRFSELNKFSDNILADGLIKAGLLKDKSKIKKYSLHGLGHHIGLDTHDAVPYEKTLTTDFDILKAGNVITIEPGLYFTKDMKEIPGKFRGMGVRIEDDILVTKNGNINLTESLIKEINEIEKK